MEEYYKYKIKYLELKKLIGYGNKSPYYDIINSIDKDFILNKIRKDGLLLKYVNDKFKNDQDVVLTAIQQNKEAILFIGNKLKMDKKFMEKINRIQDNKDINKISHNKQTMKKLKEKEDKLQEMKDFLIKKEYNILNYTDKQIEDIYNRYK